MTPAYPVVLFDLDHTLSDFEFTKKEAFPEVIRAHGVDPDAFDTPLVETFATVEKPLWAGIESGDVTLETLNDRRWSGLVEAAQLDADPASMGAHYLDALGRLGRLFPGAIELLDQLQPHCMLGLITNGYAEVQRPRLINFDLEKYFDVLVISSELGAAKPHASFFDDALRQVREADGHSDRPISEILVVGDSLTSDMTGAVNYGLPACWYNPHHAEHPIHPPFDARPLDHTVGTFEEIAQLVLGSRADWASPNVPAS